ncbi:MAG: cation:proton antiporter [Actinobacteria bacterium]|nr:cation:proton antiporter [Actinomycetota bacterium]
MSGIGFQTLALLCAVGLTGPLLASLRTFRIPVVIGELLAGIIIGSSGFGIVNPTDPTLSLLADIGFALMMFVVGTHVPVRDASLRGVFGGALLRAVIVGAVAATLAVALARLVGTGHAALYAVVMASSSAALALPVIDSMRLQGPPVLSVTAQIAIADTACIVLLPLVIDISEAGRAALGGLAVAGGAVVVYLLLRTADRRGVTKRAHHYSEHHKLALELRISLILLFGLAALAVSTHVSIMLAGFALGLAVSAVGEPRRLARQLFGITEGFFGPLFFIWLGASLQVRDLGERPGYLLLGLALGLGAVLAHAAGRLTGQPLGFAVMSAAQLGVPVAAVTLGTERGLLVHGEASAIMLGALVTIATTSVAAALASRRRPHGEPPPRQPAATPE